MNISCYIIYSFKHLFKCFTVDGYSYRLHIKQLPTPTEWAHLGQRTADKHTQHIFLVIRSNAFFFFFTVYSHKLCYQNQFDVVALSVLHDTVFNVSNTHLHKSGTLEGSLLFAASMSMHNYILTMQFRWCNADPIAVCLLPLHFHLFLPLVAEGLRFVSLLSEPLWFLVISHLFSNLSVQE